MEIILDADALLKLKQALFEAAYRISLNSYYGVKCNCETVSLLHSYISILSTSCPIPYELACKIQSLVNSIAPHKPYTSISNMLCTITIQDQSPFSPCATNPQLRIIEIQ